MYAHTYFNDTCRLLSLLTVASYAHVPQVQCAVRNVLQPSLLPRIHNNILWMMYIMCAHECEGDRERNYV